MGGGEELGIMAKRSTAMSARAGLVLPVSKASRLLRDEVPKKARVGKNAPVILSAATECLLTEVFLAAETGMKKRKRVTAHDIMRGIRSDSELHKMAGGFTALMGEQTRGVFAKITLQVKQKAEAEDA